MSDSVSDLLGQVARGEISVAEGLARLGPAYGDLGHAKIDHHRALRCGFAEVVFCQGKTPAQVAEIAGELLAAGDVFLGTRASAAHADAVREIAPEAAYHEDARVVVVDRRESPPREGHVVVATGGTADIPVAEECALCCETMGCRVTRLFDVGVAGVHRLLAHGDTLRSAEVIVAVAGMEGALPSVVAGLVAVPVIAVPTSVGYGASLGGLAALLAMLNSCAAGVSVVNIDNGFGAAAMAARINSAACRGAREAATTEERR